MNITKKLMNFIDKSPTAYQAVDNIREILDKEGFKELSFKDSFKIEDDQGYYIENGGSEILAFKGKENFQRIKMIGSHTDSPTFKLKPNSLINSDGFMRLNTEVYGGPILSTWFDRPLSLAGRVVVQSDDPFEPIVRNLVIDEDLLIIPNLAIHMNHDINSGYKYNLQKDLLPIIGLSEGKDIKIEAILGKYLDVDSKKILDYDLYLYDRQKATYSGLNREFFSVGRIDNLGMVFLSLKSLIDSKIDRDLGLIACFDNEEVGSATSRGAGSTFFSDVLKKICKDNEKDFLSTMDDSFLISADQAHSLHPSYVDQADPVNRPLINQGPVIKYAANAAYTSDAHTASVIKAICKENKIPYQEFTNRSDKRGGSTIGPITIANLNIKSVDLGNPILAMHSIRELGGCKDNDYTYKLFKAFYGF
ncbi:MAG: M18 family aminopeptidase [Finegoldia sp.]|nr:M18 family aminopeptidase [Finegoldia sp.]